MNKVNKPQPQNAPARGIAPLAGPSVRVRRCPCPSGELRTLRRAFSPRQRPPLCIAAAVNALFPPGRSSLRACQATVSVWMRLLRGFRVDSSTGCSTICCTRTAVADRRRFASTYYCRHQQQESSHYRYYLRSTTAVLKYHSSVWYNTW